MTKFTTRDDLPTMTGTTPDITVYGTIRCPNCSATEAFLNEVQLPFTKILIDQPEAQDDYEYVTGQLGYKEAPVIITKFTDHETVHWSGHRVDMLRALKKIAVSTTDDNA